LVISKVNFSELRNGDAARLTRRPERVDVPFPRAHNTPHSGGWWTLASFGTLDAIDSTDYADVPALEPDCEGQPKDGCALRWQQVATGVGDVIGDCVTNCPWQ